MTRRLPWLAAGLALAYLAAGFLPSRGPEARDAELAGALPVLQGGRVKPLDSVARNSLLALRGKQSLRREGRPVPAAAWLLDVAVRPALADKDEAFRIDDPDVLGLIGQEPGKRRYFSFEELRPHLEELEKQGRRASETPAQARTRFERGAAGLYDRLLLYHRLRHSFADPDGTPLAPELEAYEGVLGRGRAALDAHQSSGSFDREALLRFAAFLTRYRRLEELAYFRSLPPAEGEPEEAWRSAGGALVEAARTGAVAGDAKALWAGLDAWREGRREAFHEGWGGLLAGSSARLPGAARKAAWERRFNRVQPFVRGMALYVAAFLLACLGWLTGKDDWRRAGFGLLLAAFAVHTGGILVRMWLEGRPPVTNLYSSALFVGWVAALLGAALERLHRRGVGLGVAAASGFASLLVAHNLTGSGDTMEMMRAVLDSNFWLGTHVVTITIGYGGTFLAGTLAVVYILRGTLTRGLTQGAARALMQMTYGTVCFALFFSFVGTILGGIWADQSWGRFWGWDPKENGALLIVLWNAIILHARWGGFVRQRGFMVLTVFGNVITSWSWFGVNMLGIGLHSYGFMDRAFWALSAFIASQLLLMGLGLLPPRRWRSSPEPALQPRSLGS